MSRTALLVFAHPDDETFTCGGSIARYADRKDTRIVLYCATRGEAGKTAGVCPPEQLGDIRAEELKRAGKILGLDRIILRDHGDGRLKDLPEEMLADEIGAVIESTAPDVIITFPPHGISGHPDHQAVQKAALRAVLESKRRKSLSLYYVAIPESIARTMRRPVHATEDALISTVIDVSPHLERIAEALRQHRTQRASIERVFPGVFDGDLRGLRREEYFQLVIHKGEFCRPSGRTDDWFQV
ncbi:N-acetylglucosaminyl deacetylase, LmbE family [Planifilum fulgidum]|jgi:LmbE family N-acetylglucosaminyl deacetylase|uniref:N-acetylglucosaminyl deacetylase, LmbE family n=1 Tax=Planifilum fulgidum TaxID=201973 RepID=A0A1I2L6M4_9BACL|nr:PIG-L family deacetylase [Planifilum fulgidum]SFF74972.1 N-acetylglucosaminyl deacetylase, LmbE family [Planifilum fulgidum]